MTALRLVLCCLTASCLLAQDSLSEGIALDRAGKYREANRLLTEAARNKATPQVLNNLAVNLVHLQRIPEAILMFEQVLRADPKNASALFNVGSLYVATRQWDLAIARLERMLRTAPDDAAARQKLSEAHREKAERLLRAGQLQGSLPEFQSALELEPNDSSAYVGLSLALLRGNAIDEAVTVLHDASRKLPEDARIALALGYAYEVETDWANAAQWYRKAMDDDPRSAMAQAALGRVLLQSGDRAGAVEVLRAAHAADPQSAAACYELGNLLLLNDAVDADGVRLMERVAALAPTRAEPKYLLAKAALGREDLGAAKRWALAALDADPLFAAPHYLLATVYRKLDDAASAERELGLFRKMENTRRQRENVELEQAIHPRPTP